MLFRNKGNGPRLSGLLYSQVIESLSESGAPHPEDMYMFGWTVSRPLLSGGLAGACLDSRRDRKRAATCPLQADGPG